MQPAELARLLAAADEAERTQLLTDHAALANVSLAQALKKLYDDTRSSDPAGAAAALTTLAQLDQTPEVSALAA